MTEAKTALFIRGLCAALALAGVMFPLAAAPAGAQNLNEALATAYETNPTLRAQRAQLRATDEGLPEARAGWRPTVTAEGQAGVGTIDTGAGSKDLQPLAYGVYARQPLYRGGRTSASTSRASNLILAARAQLASVEQQVCWRRPPSIWMSLRDLAVLELNVRNEQVLARELNATQDRFRVGELTLTDVAQARARLAGAVAGRIQAEANLQASRADYLRIIGRAAESPQPPPLSWDCR